MTTSVTCFHPHKGRWVSPGGWVEVCAACSECRRVKPGGYWPPAFRTERREGGRRVLRDLAGRMFQSFPVLSA